MWESRDVRSKPFRQILLWYKTGIKPVLLSKESCNPQNEFLCLGRKNKGLTVTGLLVAAMTRCE